MLEISRVATIVALIINFLAIIGFIFIKNYLRRESTSKFVSFFTVALGAIFALYILSLTVLFVFSIASGHYVFAFVLAAFIVFPFVLSYKSTYEKAGTFINLQILSFVFSLFLTFIILIHTNVDTNKSNQIAKATNHSRKGILFYLKNDVTAKAKNYDGFLKRFNFGSHQHR